MHVFRLMGMPDKIIAFDGLPDELVEGFEMLSAEGFPRHWKEWLGKRERIIKVPPERDPITGQIRKYEPIVEQDNYFYVVDWMIRPVVEKWQAICDYVRQNVSKDFRLAERIETMAKPLAPDKVSAISLEPEDVVVIPVMKPVIPVDEHGHKLPKAEFLKCEFEGCNYEADGPYAKNKIRMHNMRKHPKVETKI